MSNVVVGMSGGVDSSVAAAKLVEEGNKVTGLFMKNWEEDDHGGYCAAAKDLADAEAVCKQLGIPLRQVNFAHEYWERVFQVFLKEYRNGRTPNPDVLCNKEIKFKEFLHWAMHLGADCIATGHYVRLQKSDRSCVLLKGCDKRKDQSYFLHTVGQDELLVSRFPIGCLHKSQVRKTARQLGLVTSDKKDSTGLCFIGERRFAHFLSRFLPPQAGHIKTLQGQTIGKHQGAFYYTIGQRRGLGIGGSADGGDEAWYVADKDISRNIVYVVQGREHVALYKRIVIAENLHWISTARPSTPHYCTAKTRYQQPAQSCVITSLDAHQARIEFVQPQWAVAPGQSIVFYQQDICLGGGLIHTAL